ncbi:MAG TPA: MgtC/SapB family protein [Ramlibacter sp.]|jgi:putative Mg2+ transporter-C (MgtC) family protein|uniref:MgtC/SapB family protein n=1 Tax=Ramlibacter sp. TaxID=1917967 RepID=UPI002D59C3CF|nr:MgtC/SapB family protein [Ramlibacter sp.]HZY18861.1 MgtC/SapB family protein [Ramlibacter sp.]
MAFWNTVAATVAAEFSDIANAEQFTQVVLRLLIAALLGGLIGIERELAAKPAGLRTHMLVALGSAMFILVPLQAGIEMEDLSRVIQGLLAGVGFLCAGAILKAANEDQVHGLTTSASLWMTAAIGMGAGLGREATAVLSTLLALGILSLEGPLRRWLGRRHRRVLTPDDERAPR